MAKVGLKTNWTEIESIDDYKRTIATIKGHIAGKDSLARWELKEYNETVGLF